MKIQTEVRDQTATLSAVIVTNSVSTLELGTNKHSFLKVTKAVFKSSYNFMEHKCLGDAGLTGGR
jgi:hypothetical protein